MSTMTVMRVGNLAVPLEQIPCIARDRPAEEIWEALRASALGFVVLTSDGGADVSGYLTHEQLPHPGSAYRSRPAEAAETVPAPVYLAATLAADEALRRLGRAPFAILADEYGRTSGVVTRVALERGGPAAKA